MSINKATDYFGKESKKSYGLKFAHYDREMKIINQIQKEFPDCKAESWRNYNRSFFSALKVEKNMLMFLVALIFIVVAVNIYNGMRRVVFERKNEIAILSALGARKWGIKKPGVAPAFM